MKKILLLLFVCYAASSQVLAQTNINLMSYNIRVAMKEDGENHWDHRKNDMVNQIKRYNPDILCLQEDAEQPAKFLEENTQLKGTLNIKTRGKTGAYNGIYYNESKFKIIEEGHFFLNEGADTVGKGWDAASFRMARWVKFYDKKKKVDFFVVNTHFDHKGVIARAESGKLMVAKISEIAKNKPVVLTGDFNSRPTSEAVKTITTLLKDSRVACKTEPAGPVGTFNGFKLAHKLDVRIDYIFINDKVIINTYEVSTDKAKNGNYVSDHLPIFTNLTINK